MMMQERVQRMFIIQERCLLSFYLQEWHSSERDEALQKSQKHALMMRKGKWLRRGAGLAQGPNFQAGSGVGGNSWPGGFHRWIMG